MVKIYSKAINNSISVDRIIGHIKGNQPGPVNIFMAGIQGNEPSGVFALKRVLKKLKRLDNQIKGDIYALSGNLRALEQGKRYQRQDLNRLWTDDRIAALESGKLFIENEDEIEQRELFGLLKDILAEHEGPFYFIDLHTTSSHSLPFITLSDTLLNRKFACQYPVPIVLGLEEYLKGPLLCYINDLGYLAIGFQGGKHNDLKAIENHFAFIYMTLVFTGCIPETADFILYKHHLMQSSVGVEGFFEIFESHHIESHETFKMRPGFVNFQFVKRKSYIAKIDGEKQFAPQDARILMPLYQEQGEDGYFLIRKLAPIFLHLSALLRIFKLDKLLTYLPGVSWESDKKDILKVDLKVARFFAKSFFHLLGYRSIYMGTKYMFANNREVSIRKSDYKNAQWN